MLNRGGDSFPPGETFGSVCLTGDKLFVMRLAEERMEEKETKAVECLGLGLELGMRLGLRLRVGVEVGVEVGVGRT